MAAAVIRKDRTFLELSSDEVDARLRASDRFPSSSSMRDVIRARLYSWPRKNEVRKDVDRIARRNLDAMRALNVEFGIRTP
jgi:hypothetical protein